MKHLIPVTGLLLFNFFYRCTSPADSSGAGPIDPAIDQIVWEAMDSNRVAGLSVAVARGDRLIHQNAYGVTDLEWRVPTPDSASYEIGSVTKQFTAAAILQLVEQGKLALEDDLLQYLPDYDTKGNSITIRQLLNHTSGIQGYTELPFFEEIGVRKLPRDLARGRDLEINITIAGGLLISKRPELEQPDTLQYLGNNNWRKQQKEPDFIQFKFVPQDQGLSRELRIDQVYGYYILKKEVD